jgi:hypothetical protein
VAMTKRARGSAAWQRGLRRRNNKPGEGGKPPWGVLNQRRGALDQRGEGGRR